MDAAVHDVTMGESMELTPGTLPHRITTLQFSVAKHGPFQLRYQLGTATPERINQDIQKQVDTLRAIGAIE
jgi:hypothetical protein